MQSHSSGVLLLPGDTAPSRRCIKRLLLFHNSVWIPEADDRAFVNEHEITEEFQGFGKIMWAERGRFPRNNGFEDQLEGIFRETADVQSRGLLRFLPCSEPQPPDPRLRLNAYAAAISDQLMVTSAVPDLNLGKTPKIPDTIFFGAEMSPRGARSRYEVAARSPHHMPESEEWTFLAWLRLGRTIKFLERAQYRGLIPVSLDWPNQNICLSLGSKLFPAEVSVGQLAEFAISLGAVDIDALETQLDNLSWREVLNLRREVLPKVAELRTTILKRLPKFSASHSSTLEKYEAEIHELRKDLGERREQFGKKLQEVGLSGVGKIATGAIGLGVGTIVFPSSWLQILGTVAAAGIVPAIEFAGEIHSLLSARKKVAQHPLLFFDELPKAMSRKEVEKEGS